MRSVESLDISTCREANYLKKETGSEPYMYLKQDILKIGAETRRTSKLVRGLGTLAYDEKMASYGFSNLKKRKIRGELIEAYQIVT